MSLLVVMSSGAAAELAVGSKNFSESRLLAELFAQAIEAAARDEAGPTEAEQTQAERTQAGQTQAGDAEDLDRTSGSRGPVFPLPAHVKRRLNLAGTAVCFRALRSGDIDLYPEYTGTGLVTLLGRPAGGTPAEVLRTVRREFRERWDLHWLAPLGFQNSYELAVPRALAQRLNLRTISDLAAVAGELRAGFGYEFMEREDGLVGLRRVYGLSPRSIAGMQQTLKYQAAGDGQIDLLDVYTTDGLILVHDLVVLDDDRKLFPPYAAAPLVRGEALRRWPSLARALDVLAGSLDESTMRGLNKRVEVDGESIERVAADFLQRLGLGANASADARATGRGRDRALIGYLWEQRRALGRRTLEHLGLVGLALALSILVALPLGLLLERARRSAEGVIRAAGVLQTIPSIALLAFMIPLLGVGARPAIAALFLYGLFPILRNTYTGVRDADPAATDSAQALGMSARQVLLQVRLPLAVPVILAGVRTAAVISVGTATLAAFIGAGGLGQPIVAGLQLNDSTIILSGALPAAVLALMVDGLLAVAERRLRPRGMGRD